jgi:hypothetical protein
MMHYLGNLWEEGLNSDILAYANTDQWPHDAGLPLVTLFINAYKAGHPADQMEPLSNDPIGVMWYRGMLKTCSDNPPRNVDSPLDIVNYAIILPASSEGMQTR